jgi:hypothetical protein
MGAQMPLADLLNKLNFTVRASRLTPIALSVAPQQ